MKKIIYLQQIGEIDSTILLKLKKDLKWVLKHYIDDVKVSPEIIPLIESEYDECLKQYNASKVLKRLQEIIEHQDYKFRVLGVLDSDIYIPSYNFIFGIAHKPKKKVFYYPYISLISITRLKEDFYRRDKDSSLLELRVLKEALHEIGHTFKLEHCDNFCVMKFSDSLKDTDNKPVRFCNNCLDTLNRNFQASE